MRVNVQLDGVLTPFGEPVLTRIEAALRYPQLLGEVKGIYRSGLVNNL